MKKSDVSICQARLHKEPAFMQETDRGNMRLGSGVVTGMLGEGGMAIVYEIYNERLGIKRAVKVLRPNFTAENRNRFDMEIKVTARLDHPNVIRIHSVGEWHGLPYIEMEHIDGYSLRDIIQKRGAIPLDVSVAVGLVVSRALTYTHSMVYQINGTRTTGILHRDLKPENILISYNGIVRLTDFGIATPVNVSMHTPDGSIVGSLQYIAPEQLNDEEIDCRADIFSFGCVMYEILTGFKTFPDKTITKLISKRTANDYDPLTMYRTNAPARLNRLVSGCLQHNPDKRPQSMNEVAHELGRILGSRSRRSAEEIIADFVGDPAEPVRVVSINAPATRAAPRWIAAAAVALGLIVASSVAPRLAARFDGFRSLRATTFSGSRMMASVLPALPARAVQSADSPPESTVAVRVAPKTYADSMRVRYKADNLLDIMKILDARGYHHSVLKISKELSRTQAHSKTGVLLTARALDKTGKLSPRFFRDTFINDAEYHLIKARFFYRTARYDDALACLEKVHAARPALADNEDIRRQALACKARVLTAQFYVRPDSDIHGEALRIWENVMRAYNDRPGHDVYKEALRTTARLGQI